MWRRRISSRMSLQEAFDFALPIVEELRHKQTGPQTPQVLADMPVLRIGLSASGARGIPIR